MSTQSNDHRLQAIETDQIQADEATRDEAGDCVMELGKVSDTQGGFLGAKYDSGLGWEAF